MSTSGKYCCCPIEGCLIGSDNFNRANGSPGSNWSASAGTWSISSNKLTTSSTNAYLKYQTAHPDSVAGHFVTVKMTFSSPGDKGRIVLADGVYAEVEWRGECPVNDNQDRPGCSVVRLFQGTTLLDEARTEIQNGSVVSAGYIKADSVAWLAVLPGSFCLSATTSTASSYYVGLGTGDTNYGGIDFDDFEFYRAKSATYPACPDACQELIPDDPCIIAFPPCYDQKNSLVSSDLYCDWTILFGTWDGFKTASRFGYALWLETVSTDALIICDEEQEEGTFGYHKATVAVKGQEGDKVKIYLDFDGTSNCHMAEVQLGDSVFGRGGYAKLYKNGTLIETERTWDDNQQFLINSAYKQYITACLQESEDGSGNDIFNLEIKTASTDGDTEHHLHAVTSVNGNKKWAFGTGDTVNSNPLKIEPGYFRYVETINGEVCPDCGEVGDCDPCPGNDGPLNGYSFTVAGITATYSDTCVCTSWNGTYIVDGNGTCGQEKHASNSAYQCIRPELGGGYYYLKVWYEIVAATGSDWKLRCYIQLIGTDPNNIWASNYEVEVGIAVYEATYTQAMLCREISAQQLTYNSALSTLPISGYNPFYQCTNWDNLIVTATAW